MLETIGNIVCGNHVHGNNHGNKLPRYYGLSLRDMTIGLLTEKEKTP